ncbi:MAG TPA: SAM-dependent methyltransferase [Gammaproteobacteria bacterium]|nr:SAM-dependent methyltransferase [Gammaproteobacteria bacterium]
MQATERPTPKISKTAIWVAAARAVGAREPDPSARNPDHLAELLLGDPAALSLEHPTVQALTQSYDEAMKNAEVVGNVRFMTVRTRFIDAALERAIADGATQVVILGAGFDSHAYRFQELLADVRVFEVDRPATQAFKRQRVDEALGGPPANLTYAAIDFEREDLPGGLARYGHDPSRRTFFIMEGLVMYLPEAAVRATLAFVASHAPGSSVVFDFFYTPMVEMIARLQTLDVPAAAKTSANRFLSMIQGEPWLSGLPVGGEREHLRELGLTLREVLPVGGAESVKRYLTKADGTQVGAQTLAGAMARMADYFKSAGPGESTGPAQAFAERMREQQRTMVYQLADAVVP